MTTPAEWANLLDAAARMGATEDTPEGVRYIQISDTLARQMAASLRGSEAPPPSLFPANRVIREGDIPKRQP